MTNKKSLKKSPTKTSSKNTTHHPLPKRLVWWGAWLTAITTIYLLLSEVIAPFIVAFALAWLMKPASESITRKLQAALPATPKHIWKPIVALMLTIALLAVLAILLAATLPFILREVISLISNAPAIISNLQNKIDNIELLQRWQHLLLAAWERIRENNPDMSQWQSFTIQASKRGAQILSQTLTLLSKQTSSIIALLSWFALVPFATFYMLKDWDKAMLACRKRIPAHEKHLNLLCARIDETISALVRGQLSVIFIMAIFYALMLTIIGLPYGFAIGFIAGIVILVPYVGALLGAITALAVAYFHFGFSTEFTMTIATFLFGQLVESYFLTPRLVGEKIGLHPLWIIFAILSGAKIAGITGVLLALPIGATIRAIVAHIDACNEK